MKLSKILGKKIISTAGKESYVLSVTTDGATLFFVCVDGNEKEFTVDVQNVLRLGDSILYNGVKSAKKPATVLRLGRACYDINGKYAGKLIDITFMNKKLKSAKIGKNTYPAEALILGDVILVKT